MIAKLDIKKITENFNHLDVDCFLVFRLLQVSPVVIVDQPMCTLTVGNGKYYLRPKNIDLEYKLEVIKKLHLYWIARLRERRLYIENTEMRTEKIFINLLFLPRFCMHLLDIIVKKFLSNNIVDNLSNP